MLQSGTMSAIDFINKVRHNDEDLCQNLTTIDEDGEFVSGDDDTELEQQIQAELLVAEEEMDASLEYVPQNMDMVHNDESNRSNTPEPQEGSCIACNVNLATVVFLDCKHNAVCSDCYTILLKTHQTNCTIWYRDNPRKMAREMNRIKCPNCGSVANDVIKTHSNSFK